MALAIVGKRQDQLRMRQGVEKRLPFSLQPLLPGCFVDEAFSGASEFTQDMVAVE